MWLTIRTMLPPADAEYSETLAESTGQAREAAEAAARDGAQLIVAIGGDGTLHEALNGVMAAPASRRPALAFVPGGTANLLARALGIPRSIPDIGRCLAAGIRREIDVGQANGRYFATIAAVGFDAEVVAGAITLRRRIGSKPAHIARALTTLAWYRPSPARIRSNGAERVVPLTFLAAANTEWYGGGLHLAPGARPDDGRLLVVYGAGLTRVQTLDVMIRAFIGRHLRHPKVVHYPARAVTVESARPLALHADGEWLGRWPTVTFEVVPRALQIIVPRHGILDDGGRA